METKTKKSIYQQTGKDAALAMELNTIILYDANKPRITLGELFEKNKLFKFIIERKYLGNTTKYDKKKGCNIEVEQYSRPVRIIAEFTNDIQFVISNAVFKYYSSGIDVEFKTVR